MRIFKRNGSPNWWVTWNDQDGKRNRRSFGTTDKKLAEALAARWAKEGFMEEHFGKFPEVPFSEALLRYAKVHKRDHRRSFERSTRYRLRLLQEWFGDTNISEITLGLIQAFLDERLDEVSLAAAQKEVSTLRAILNKAHREELLAMTPRFPKFKALKNRTRWLTNEEMERLAACSARHLVPLVLFAVDTGGRRSELLRLDWRQVDLARKRVVFLNTKNGEDRAVRLCDRACAVLAGLGPKETGPVFTFRGKAVRSMQTAFNKAREKAGLQDVRFHDLRHTFASRLVQGGVPLYDVKHLMGHKSLEMVQRYAHLAPEYQEGAIQVLNTGFGHKMGTITEGQVA
jgi:integrase